MSWLARSLANSLRLDDDEYCAENDVVPASPNDHGLLASKRGAEDAQLLNEETQQEHPINEEKVDEEEEEEAQGRGMKDDLTELGQTLTRQLWGVASFLAPPPTSPTHRTVSNLDQVEPSDRSTPHDVEVAGDSAETSGIGHDFAEIGGRFRSGVTEISKMASNYFPFGSEENERGSEELETEEFDDWGAEAVGITDEVLAFARNIAMHPETWLDFPLDQEEDLDDSTNMMQRFCQPLRTFDFGGMASLRMAYEAEKHPVASNKIQFIDKSVIEEMPVTKAEGEFGRSSKFVVPNYEDDEDDWLEEDSDLGGYKTSFPTGNEEDISFSDLEDDANATITITPKKLTRGTKTPTRQNTLF